MVVLDRTSFPFVRPFRVQGAFFLLRVSGDVRARAISSLVRPRGHSVSRYTPRFQVNPVRVERFFHGRVRVVLIAK